MKEMVRELEERIIIGILNCIINIYYRDAKRRNELSYFHCRYRWVAFSLIGYMIELL